MKEGRNRQPGRKDEQARALAPPHSKSADPARNGREERHLWKPRYCSFPDAEAATDAVAVSFLYSALA